MPYANPDPTDPMSLNGVSCEIDANQAELAHQEMALCFVQEYLRMGFDPQQILQLFQTSAYAGPFMAYGVLGREAILSIIDEQMRIRGMSARSESSPVKADGDISLGVLDS